MLDRRLHVAGIMTDVGPDTHSDAPASLRITIQDILPPHRWVHKDDRTECVACRRKFNPLFRRRHHCRLCGDLFCKACVISPPVEGGHLEAIKVCRPCTFHASSSIWASRADRSNNCAASSASSSFAIERSIGDDYTLINMAASALLDPEEDLHDASFRLDSSSYSSSGCDASSRCGGDERCEATDSTRTMQLELDLINLMQQTTRIQEVTQTNDAAIKALDSHGRRLNDLSDAIARMQSKLDEKTSP
ncbi:Aste57867_24261 [Aphanomyces stellatus]|uniref:Aste57867_24261 protein n=1 Tax=Aphanomyces stellatus TaxID=120398 RepID=A0A485LQ17_9STRA|nr:hypothetical protein As57867_024186 [Aphanomyces stellatus]VFU00901.1 Aste57867_24261 [Aphanomyces stellatus]